MTEICRHLLISGRVQGVCFRHYTRQTALQHALHGWVRNLPDGRVEAVIAGEAPGVEATIAWCRRGPEAARVDRVEVEEIAPDQKNTGFTIR